MHYKYIEVTGGIIFYLIGALLIWFFVVQGGIAAPTDGAFIFLGIAWSLSTVIAFSFIESRHSSPRALVGWGLFLVFAGAVTAALSLIFGAEEWFKFFFSNAILFPTASAGANFLAQGAVELIRGVNPTPSPEIVSSAASPQRLIEVGYCLLGVGLLLATIFFSVMPTELLRFFTSNLFLLLGGSIGMCLVSQGIIERGRHNQIAASPAP